MKAAEFRQLNFQPSSYIDPKDFNERNFAPIFYTTQQGKELPMYEMTRDGFMFLAIGFTGKNAAKFKEAFISAFNSQEELIKKLLKENQERAERELAEYTRQHLKTGYRKQTDAIKASYEAKGLQAKPEDYAKNADMNNILITGMTANIYKKTHQCKSVRDHLKETSLPLLIALEKVQTFDAVLIELGLSLEERQERLNSVPEKLGINATKKIGNISVKNS